MAEMLGLDRAQASACIAQKLDWNRFAPLRFMMEPLCQAMVQSQVDYLHACGALDDDGDSGDGEYEEDEAVEFILDALLSAFPCDEERAVQYCALIDAFLPLFDDYLFSQGLLSL